MGAVFTPNDHQISYFSKKKLSKITKFFNYVRELHAITVSVQNGVIIS